VTLNRLDERFLAGRVQTVKVVSGSAWVKPEGKSTQTLAAGESANTEDLPTRIVSPVGAEVAWQMTSGF
jgi:hypothetical protein